jgi:NitT/TauT family transport system ATP-binding protein
MRDAAPLVSLRGVSKRYADGTLALAELNFSVNEGEFLSLLGPSGCGKSTALRLIAELAAPSAGEVTRQEGSGRDIGFVFQEPTLMPWARVLENVTLPLRLAKVARPEAEARAADALAQVGLQGSERAFPRQLSGGMKMRVSIARALVTRPRLLLMDEPFAALDEITRLKLNEDLLRLWSAQGWTIVFVTHSVYESVFLSSRILVMAARPGRITADIPLALPYPRLPELRHTPLYAEHCAGVSAALHAAMPQAGRAA